MFEANFEGKHGPMGMKRRPPIPSARDLAKRLNVAVDRFELLRGEPLTFPEIHKYLDDLGISLSRSRWSYMLRGEGWKVSDRDLLAAVADFLDTPVDYFYTGALPERFQAEMGLIRAMRAAKVQNYAARVLGDVDPEALEAIAEALADRSGAVDAASDEGFF